MKEEQIGSSPKILKSYHEKEKFSVSPQFDNSDDSQIRKSVAVIIPAFNEESGIGKVLDELKQLCNNYEIIVVDDGSNDRTADIAREVGVKVLRHDFNKGYGASLTTGVRNTDSDYIVCFDADGQHKAEDIDSLLDYLSDYDLVVGARTKGSHVQTNRILGKRLLSIFANLLAGTTIPDLNSGLRAFRREILLKYIHLMPAGFSFSTTSTFAFLKSNRQIKYIPILTNRRVGESSVKQFRHGLETVMLMLRLAVLFGPLKIFLPMSGVLTVFTIASVINDIRNNPAGIADTSILLAVSAIIIFFSGYSLTRLLQCVEKNMIDHILLRNCSANISQKKLI